MTARLEPRFVGDLFGSFSVPAYQRGYRWGDAEVERLLDDIADEGHTVYYLQPIVVKSLGEDRWELIDGQQRLTTLYLLFAYLQREGYKKSGPPFAIEYETRPRSREFLEDPTAEAADDNVDFHHMYGALHRIDAWFTARGTRAELHADKLYRRLFDNVKVIWYEVDDGSTDPIALFTRLNVGRIPLTDAELVKALLLTRLAAEGDRAQQVAAQWDQFERDLHAPEIWASVTASAHHDATRIELLLECAADQITGKESIGKRLRFETFEAVRPRIERNPGAFWDGIVGLHSLLIGWFEDRSTSHKVGYLVATGDSFGRLVTLSTGLSKSAIDEMLTGRIRDRIEVSANDVRELDYRSQSDSCLRVLLLMNVETARRRPATERYSFHSHATGAWSLEHIHAQNAQDMKRDEKIWGEWLVLHRDAIADVPTIEQALREELLGEIDEVVALLGRGGQVGVGARFDALRPRVEAALSPSGHDGGADIHLISNLALLSSPDNSALSNSTFEVKRRSIIRRDREGGVIPPCTRNVFLKYYTDADDQQIHFWGPADRQGYLDEMLTLLDPYLMTETSR